MLCVDELPSIYSKGKFARIYIEIDLRKQSTLFFTTLGHVFSVKYEGLHLICFKCGKYGHKANYYYAMEP